MAITDDALISCVGFAGDRLHRRASVIAVWNIGFVIAVVGGIQGFSRTNTVTQRG